MDVTWRTSSGSTSSGTADPYLNLTLSATSGVTRRRMPRSAVTLRPPIGIVAQCEIDVVARSGDGDHAARVLRADVAAADPDEGGPDLQSREPLRRVDRARHRLHRPIDVDDHAFAKAVGRRLTDADDVDATA